MTERIVVIGAGHGGGELCAALRQQGFAGAITLIGDEPHPPYQRPPLSKAYLTGGTERAHLFLKGNDFYEDSGIALRLGQSVAKIDRSRKCVQLSDGSDVPYTRLAIATGARPRPLPVPGADCEGVHYLRTIRDADAIAPLLRAGQRLAVIGGGYIGLEIASSARKSGVDVVVIERLSRLLARVASEALSARVHRLHTAHGVTIRLDTEVGRIEAGGAGPTLHLAGGGPIETDVVVVGIGVIPNQDLAAETGLLTRNGIIVDAHCRTSDPDIFALGDVAEHPNRLFGRVRLESVQNAVEQAKACARNMLGAGQAYDAIPWFWSEQFDCHLQIAGLSGGAEQTILRPGRDEHSGSLWNFRAGRLIAVEAMNDAKAYMMGRRWLAGGTSPDPGLIIDPERDLKTLA